MYSTYIPCSGGQVMGAHTLRIPMPGQDSGTTLKMQYRAPPLERVSRMALNCLLVLGCRVPLNERGLHRYC